MRVQAFSFVACRPGEAPRNVTFYEKDQTAADKLARAWAKRVGCTIADGPPRESQLLDEDDAEDAA